MRKGSFDLSGQARLALATLLIVVGASCEMSASKNPLISDAKTLLISSNIPVGKAWKSESKLLSSDLRQVPVSGVNVTEAVIAALPPNLQARTLPASVLQEQFKSRSLIEKMGQQKIDPLPDCDLVLWLESIGPTTSQGYYNAAAGAYISGATTVQGLWFTEDRTLGSPGGGTAQCSYQATLFDAKSGEPLSRQGIVISLPQKKEEQIHSTLKRAVQNAAQDTVIVLGLKAGKLTTVYIRDERMTRQQKKADTLATHQKVDAATKPIDDSLEAFDQKLSQIQADLWKQSRSNFKKAFGVGVGVKDPAPAAAPETTSP
jgi:hypothetical protein